MTALFSPRRHFLKVSSRKWPLLWRSFSCRWVRTWHVHGTREARAWLKTRLPSVCMPVWCMPLVQVGCPPEAPASRAPSRGASSRGPSPAPSNPARGGSRARGRGRGAQPAAGGKARGRGRKRGYGEVAAEDCGVPGALSACAVCGGAAVGEAELFECSGGAACGKRFHLLCLDPPPSNPSPDPIPTP